jgi:hypothetical protein
LPPPCVLRTRGSVKDVQGHGVKDVMGLNTKNAKERGTLCVGGTRKIKSLGHPALLLAHPDAPA